MQVVIGGTAFERWQEVDLDSDVMTPADAFNVRGPAPDAKALGLIREGATCDIYVGDDRQMAGVIDDVTHRVTRRTDTVDIVGRDKGAYLIDCEVEPVRAQDYTLRTLAEKLLQPSWGIRNVIVSNEDNRKLLLGRKDRKTKAGTSRRGAPLFSDPTRELAQSDHTDRVARILDERTRQLGVTWWLTAEGDLFIGKPNYHQEIAYQFLLFDAGNPKSRYNNVETADVRRSMGDRYSTITVIGQSNACSGLFSTATTVKGAKFKASAQDPDLVARGIVRTTFVHDGDIANRKQSQARADFEMGKRRMQALSLRVTVPGFRQGDRLYAIDTLASVQIERGGMALEGVFWVAQRRFLESRQKRRTELTLYPKGVWLP